MHDASAAAQLGDQCGGDLRQWQHFIGGKVEEAAAPSVLSGIRKERQVGLAWLQA